MANVSARRLHVVVGNLGELRVVCVSVFLRVDAGAFNRSIQQGFNQVKGWASRRAMLLGRVRLIGIPHTVGSRLVAYECGVESDVEEALLDDGYSVKRLAGGRYAVLRLVKDSSTIGEAIGRFYSEYAPCHHLEVDEARQSYEVYVDNRMDYCVPIQ